MFPIFQGNCRVCNLYVFCASPWLLFGTSNGHGRCSWSPFQPSASTTMCTSGRGQRCFSVMQHGRGGDHIPSPPLLHFCCICSSVWHTVKLALIHQTENDTVWTGSYLSTSLYTHLILILQSVILQATLLAFVVNSLLRIIIWVALYICSHSSQVIRWGKIKKFMIVSRWSNTWKPGSYLNKYKEIIKLFLSVPNFIDLFFYMQTY